MKNIFQEPSRFREILVRWRNSYWARYGFIGAAFAAATITLWALWNQPTAEPPWPHQIAGVSFSPLRPGNDPAEGKYPTVQEIEADLALLAGKVRSIRTYGLGGTLAEIPKLARKHGMTVTLGAWLDSDAENNRREMERLIEVARKQRNVTRVIVGNEVLLRGDLTPAGLIDFLDQARKALRVPVSTAEPWHVWLKYPELAYHVDFIGAHFLPYWEGAPLDAAVDQVAEKCGLLQAAFPDLPLLIAEVGWPSNGRTRRSAVASDANEAIFLRRFLARAQVERYDYYLMEAFDQPWKSSSEGAVGAYWGIYDVERNRKFAFVEPIVRVPGWKLLAGASVFIALFTLRVLLIDGNALQDRARGFLAAVANCMAAGTVWVTYDYLNRYLTPFTVIVGIILALGLLGIVLVLLTEAHEMAESKWVTGRRRSFSMPRPADLGKARPPKVSVHVPAYNEPPAMMIETLNALAKLDYSDFEVLVIDNNTRDPAVWKPVERHCGELGSRFRFFHVDPLAGFKAGALNFALRETAPDAEIVAVIDSDYQVGPDWLTALVPHFARPEIAVVQAPQDYLDERENLFKRMCYAEYKGFFHIGMVTRNDRNAIIEHGTMTMIRARVLREVGGWAEWCITEDAELGLRIFEHGYEEAYTEKSYGKGLIPDSFSDYKKQRVRWAYGAVQILRRHGPRLLGLAPSRLTWGQRYHFLAGWLPWLADGLNLFYTLGALAWSAAIILDPKQVDPPLAVFTLPPVLLFSFKLGKLFTLYRARVGATFGQAFGAALAGLALSHSIARAVVSGFLTRDKPFVRTPKCENRPILVRALLDAAEESALFVALCVAAAGVAFLQARETPGSLLWSAVLLVQATPYLAAVLLSLINAKPEQRLKSLKAGTMTVSHQH